MNGRTAPSLILAGGICYLALLTWSMTSLSYDIWGAFIIGPLLLCLGLAVIRRLFREGLQPLQAALVLGLVAKFAGAAARYWVAFDVYGGGSDAQRYHLFARAAANKVWSG